jgi:hypothetical protein
MELAATQYTGYPPERIFLDMGVMGSPIKALAGAVAAG